MKFSCERCGKKYATAEDPAPGRVYKLKCKACGHLIVVKASAAAPASDPAAAPEPSLRLEIPTTPEPYRVAEGTDSSRLEVSTDSGRLDTTTEVSTAGPRGHAGEPTPPPGESGYVDLFSEASGQHELPQRPSDDPFLAAARASLPEGYGGGSGQAPDPFAGLRDDISATSEPEPPPRAPPPVPKVPVIPKPRQDKSNVPLVLIGAGVAVLVGILAFVMLSSGTKGTAAPQRPAAAAAAPAPAPEPPVASPEPAEPAQAAPPVPPPPAAAEKDEAERRARAEQKKREREEAQAREEQARADRARDRADRDARDRAAREDAARAKAERDAQAKADREAKAQREREARAQRDREAREAREAKERAAAEARERERAARQAAAAEKAAVEPEGGLTQAQIEGVLRSTKTAFDSCIQGARGSDVKLDGRRVMLRLNIQTTGTVTYPTLDDVTLNGTELGSCLKSAARLMVFPKFKGDTMHVEVPLVMR